MANQKLELTWIGKGQEPAVEPRILLHDPSKDYGDPNTENMLIHGDNLLALKALEQQYAGQVKCIYIDPPYNTGEAFEEYDDNVEHSTWLQLMNYRLKILNTLLSDDGIIFVQLNDDEMNYCKVLMDEIFGRSNFVNLIAVKTKNSSGASGGGEDKKLKKNIEFIMCYGKSLFKKFNPAYTVVELSEYLQEMSINGTSFKYTTVFTDLGKRTYYKTIKDGSGNDIVIYSHSGYKLKAFGNLQKKIIFLKSKPLTNILSLFVQLKMLKHQFVQEFKMLQILMIIFILLIIILYRDVIKGNLPLFTLLAEIKDWSVGLKMYALKNVDIFSKKKKLGLYGTI